MSDATGLSTIDDLLAAPADQRCELVKGVLVMMTPANWGHGVVAARIGALLSNHAAAHGGKAFGAETGFVLSRDPDTVRAPDAAYIGPDRAGQLDPASAFGNVPPDALAEVVSVHDRPIDVHEKAQMWVDAGLRLVWVIWPPTRSVTVHRPGREIEILHESDRTDGEDVMPGLGCAVADLFD